MENGYIIIGKGLSAVMALSPEILVPRLGEVLVSEGLITNEQLNLALEKQKKITSSNNPVRIGEILVEQGYLSREDLDQAITRQILRFQQALVASNRTLEERVRARTGELEAAYRKLSELDVIKSNFISNISHELRTPLTHLKGYIDLLMTTDGIEVNPEIKPALEVMQRSAERLENLINDLIMFSIAENGQLQISSEKFNLKEVASIILSRHQTRAENKKICLEMDCPFDVLYVFADKNRITWVINQLVDNAIKFMNNQGKIILHLTTLDNQAIIAVQDHGVELSDQQIREAFMPFHQLDGSASRRQGGTGLGLALARQIVETHGSKIIVHSEPGKGSTFEFNLPVTEK